jgi:hypothetical protein
MRTLLRNKRRFYYASYIGETEILDEYGNSTGEYSVSYSNPIECLGNISAAQGEMQSRQFGESESYDKVIVLDERGAPVDEHSVLWVDTLPHLNGDGTTATPYDYTVKRVARSLNGVSIAIRKVQVNG